MGDGTVYEFTDVTTCDTSATAPDSLPIPNGYDILASTADGDFQFYAARGGLNENAILFSASISGDFDDQGRNGQIRYDIEGDGTDLVVDGAQVSGTATMRASDAPGRPHGEETTITVEARC
ncbi:MAG: hypothetical protein AAGA99_21565 [Actinomycetota bacterium]